MHPSKSDAFAPSPGNTGLIAFSAACQVALSRRFALIMSALRMGVIGDVHGKGNPRLCRSPTAFTA